MSQASESGMQSWFDGTRSNVVENFSTLTAGAMDRQRHMLNWQYVFAQAMLTACQRVVSGDEVGDRFTDDQRAGLTWVACNMAGVSQHQRAGYIWGLDRFIVAEPHVNAITAARALCLQTQSYSSIGMDTLVSAVGAEAVRPSSTQAELAALSESEPMQRAVADWARTMFTQQRCG